MSSRLKDIIPFRVAVWSVVVLTCIITLFHLLVLLQFIPFDIVWAGKLKSVEEMVVFESASIAINSLLLFVVIAKGEVAQLKFSSKVINIILWIFVVVFTLNTLGNLTAASTLETMIATPLTAVLAVLCWRLAIQGSPTKN